MIRTTIVIPNYNGIQYLKNCITSILACGDEVAVLVVDNASDDGSYEMLRRFPMVQRVRMRENTGFCRAVNVGIKKSRTEFVLLLNNDIEVERHFVSNLERAMDMHPDAFSINARMRSLHSPEKIDSAGVYYCALGWAFDYGKGKPDDGRYDRPREIFASCGGASLYRKNIFYKIGFFDENHFAYLEDVDIGFRARIYGYKNYYEPTAIVYHAGSGASGSKYNLFKTNLSSRNSIYIIGKNMPVGMVALNFPILLLGFLIKTLFFIKKGMGCAYVRGLSRGLALCLSRSGKKHHITFRKDYLRNYLKIQWELWRNLLFWGK